MKLKRDTDERPAVYCKPCAHFFIFSSNQEMENMPFHVKKKERKKRETAAVHHFKKINM